jgi:hypothetical protein
MLYSANVSPSSPEIVELQKRLTDLRIEEWLTEDIFHLKWWFLLGLFAVSVYIWWRLVDKTRLEEICLYGAIVTIITLGLDEYGDELTLWDYPVDILPIFPPLTAINLATLPVIYMYVYQRYGTWKSFVSASSVMAGLFAFILEPVLVWGKLYEPLHWQYYYGFPIYVAMGIAARVASLTIRAISHTARTGSK